MQYSSAKIRANSESVGDRDQRQKTESVDFGHYKFPASGGERQNSVASVRRVSFNRGTPRSDSTTPEAFSEQTPRARSNIRRLSQAYTSSSQTSTKLKCVCEAPVAVSKDAGHLLAKGSGVWMKNVTDYWKPAKKAPQRQVRTQSVAKARTKSAPNLLFPVDANKRNAW